MAETTVSSAKLVPQRRLWLAWLGGMSLGMLPLASAYIGYRYAVVGTYGFQALQFIERDIARPHPDCDVYTNGARAKHGLVLKIPDGAFTEAVFEIRSTEPVFLGCSGRAFTDS